MAATKPTQKFNESRLNLGTGQHRLPLRHLLFGDRELVSFRIIYDGNYSTSTRFPYICRVASHVFPDVIWPNWPPDQIPVKKNFFSERKVRCPCLRLILRDAKNSLASK